MCNELPFEPIPFIKGSHGQTIVGSFLNLTREPYSVTKFIALSDGDEIALEVSTPDDWDPNGLTLIMIHGLCGSHKSGYLVRMTKRLIEKKVRCVRMNLRGCGSGRGHAKNIYHSGRSDDLAAVIQELAKETPNTRFVIMGFSLGGNIVLKYGGEEGIQAKDQIQQIISICPPTDLYSSIELIRKPSNRFYERYFLRLLKSDVRFRQKKFPEIPRVNFPRNLSMMEFDELYTAPRSGYQNAMDYYNRCSSKIFIPEIKVPTRILLSKDDPIICHTSLDDISLSNDIQIYKTSRGGHLGYLSTRGRGGFHWIDHILEEWTLDEL